MAWAKVIDQGRCIGCHACTTACKSENEVPLGVTRTYVKHVDVGLFPQVRRVHQVTRCNHCANAPCVEACPTAAMHARPDGIVDIDGAICIGCKACLAACPYDAVFINPEHHSAEKCTLCAHRLEVGLEPACVVVCPVEAIVVGDRTDPLSPLAALVGRESVTVRRPEKGTRPQLFYLDAHVSTLDPLAARRPQGGLFMWSEQGRGPGAVVSGHPDGAAAPAPALLSYDVPHRRPWDWRVSLYTWTKGFAAGAYLVAAALVLSGIVPAQSALWRSTAPLLSVVALAITGALLVWDLEHPARFWMILARPQWRSWLTRGAAIIAAYGGVLALHLLASALGSHRASRTLAIAGVPLAIATAVYTAFLFAQAKGRDLWQSPLLAPHMLVQALLLGAAALVQVPGSRPLLAGATLVHLLLVWADAAMPHPTAHARLAVREMLVGEFALPFWAGVGLSCAALAGMAAGVPPQACAAAAAIAVLLHEHAFVQAGQAVPLA